MARERDRYVHERDAPVTLFERLLRLFDLSREPHELFKEVRLEIERELRPQWIAYYHRSPETGTIHFDSELTSAELLSILGSSSDRALVPYQPPVPGPTQLSPEEAAKSLATLAGVEVDPILRVFEQRRATEIYFAPVDQRNLRYGYLALGLDHPSRGDNTEKLDILRGLIGHLCYILDIVSVERTRSAAFQAAEVPSLLTNDRGAILEVNGAFREFFDLPAADGVTDLTVESFFALHAQEGTRELFKREYLARPAVASFSAEGPRISGVLHSLAGARTREGTRMRYFYFLPDDPAGALIAAGSSAAVNYPTLDLPEELALTAREIDVAVRIAAGESSKEIARRLSVSIRTVQFHRQSLRDKLGIVGRGLSLRHALLQYERPVS